MRIDEITPLSEKDQTQLVEFLQSLANESDEEHQTLLKIQLNDNGEFTVKVSFLTDVPAWKLSYRLTKQEESKFRLDTFGIVDNTTLVDWVDANLVLSTKTPVSFKYDLSTPHNITRSVISRKNSTDIDIPVLRPSSSPNVVDRMGRSRGMEQSNFMPQSEMAYEQEEMNFFETAIEGQATLEAGESIEYRLSQPVTIKRKQSSMVPLSTNQIDGSRKLYFNSKNHRSHPFYVIEFSNTLEYTIENGPITVYGGRNEFWGEAMLPRIVKNEDFLLTYALNKNMSVKTESKSKTFLEQVTIKNLSRIEIMSQIRNHTFEIDNKGDDQADLYLSIPKDDYKPFSEANTNYYKIILLE